MAMNLKEIKQQMVVLKQQLGTLADGDEKIKQLEQALNDVLGIKGRGEEKEVTPYDKVTLARRSDRPSTKFYLSHIFDDFFMTSGDRLYGEDKAIIGGIATLEGRPVTVIGHVKGQNFEENMATNFGMPHPEGYRKAIRLAKQAEKFNRPIVTFIDTPGAYPGIGAEERGQSEAIARCLMTFMDLTVPVIAVVIGEGGSGGALAISGGNAIIMLENSVYSVLSPEGFASILYKDASRAKEAATLMKLTAADLEGFGIVDELLEEPTGGAHVDGVEMAKRVKGAILTHLDGLSGLDGSAIRQHRYEKFMKMGAISS